jgi:hypothetical protein
LADRGEITADVTLDHDCGPGPAATEPGVLFCPIDRRGVPETRRCLSPRAVTAIVAGRLHRAAELAPSTQTTSTFPPPAPWGQADRVRAAGAR